MMWKPGTTFTLFGSSSKKKIHNHISFLKLFSALLWLLTFYLYSLFIFAFFHQQYDFQKVRNFLCCWYFRFIREEVNKKKEKNVNANEVLAMLSIRLNETVCRAHTRAILQTRVALLWINSRARWLSFSRGKTHFN